MPPIELQCGQVYFYDGSKFNALKLADLFSLYKLDSTMLYIVDGHRPPNVDARVLLISCPRYECYREMLSKKNAKLLYMPIWSEHEIKSCAALSFPNINRDLYTTSYKLCGGIPRFVFNFVSNKISEQMKSQISCDMEEFIKSGLTDSINKAVNSCICNADAIFKYQYEFYHKIRQQYDPEISNRILHLIPSKDYSEVNKFQFSSTFIADKVYEKLAKQDAYKYGINLAEGLKSINSVNTPILAEMFERSVNDILSIKKNVHLFNTRSLTLNSNDATHNQIIPIEYEFPTLVETFNDFEDFTQKVFDIRTNSLNSNSKQIIYLKPKNDKFPTLDSYKFIFDKGNLDCIFMFNMTLNKEHRFAFNEISYLYLHFLYNFNRNSSKSNNQLQTTSLIFYYVTYTNYFESFKISGKNVSTSFDSNSQKSQTSKISSEQEKVSLSIKNYITIADNAFEQELKLLDSYLTNSDCDNAKQEIAKFLKTVETNIKFFAFEITNKDITNFYQSI